MVRDAQLEAKHGGEAAREQRRRQYFIRSPRLLRSSQTGNERNDLRRRQQPQHRWGILDWHGCQRFLMKKYINLLFKQKID